jgi:SAM-dependent methyltransferase
MAPKSSQYTYHQGDDAFAIASMKKYLDKKQEMDKLLDKIISPFIADKKLQILDAGCGLGHSLFFLNDLSPESNLSEWIRPQFI